MRTLLREISRLSRHRANSFSLFLDGFDAGPKEDSDNPPGVGGLSLHERAFATRTFQRMAGQDDGFIVPVLRGGAWIIGRNMFGPIRGLMVMHRAIPITAKIRDVIRGRIEGY